jgi:hypothetical protein
MFGMRGKKRPIGSCDRLGHLIPASTLTLERLEGALIQAAANHRFLAGHGIPSIPTRFVIRMAPADRAWLGPHSEDLLARAVESHADRTGSLVVGSVDVAFRPDPMIHPGHPQIWAGFTEDDLLVLSSPRAAVEIFASA